MEAFTRDRSYIGKSNWPDALFIGFISDFKVFKHDAFTDEDVRRLAGVRS